LKELRIDENGLRSLSNFPNLPNLSVLSCAGNRINDIVELEKLCRVCDPKDISFANNPVTRKQLYRPTVLNMFSSILVIDGREVSAEERERALHFLHNDRNMLVYQNTNGVAGGARNNNANNGGGVGGLNSHTSTNGNLSQAQLQQQMQLSQQNSQLLPATVKLTAVSFETFAGFNSNQQLISNHPKPPSYGNGSQNKTRNAWNMNTNERSNSYSESNSGAAGAGVTYGTSIHNFHQRKGSFTGDNTSHAVNINAQRRTVMERGRGGPTNIRKQASNFF